MLERFHHRSAHYTLLLAVASLVCLVNLGAPSLWDIDEGHNAEAAREMLVTGDWLVPTFNFQLRSDKPVLLYWLQLGAYRLFGVNEFAARLPSAVAGMLTVLLTYELGRRLFRPSTGLLAGLVLASSALFCAATHFANPDALLLTFTTLTCFIFWTAYARGGRGWFVPAGISTGLAVLAKGPVGLVLPLAVAGTFLLWSRQLGRLWDRRLAWGAAAFIAVAAPWYIWVGIETRLVFLRDFFLVHNTGRFQGTMEGHGGPVYYYLVCLALGLAPWSIFLLPAAWAAWGRQAREDGKVIPVPRPPTPVGRIGNPSDQPDGLPIRPTPAAIPPAYRFLWCWILTYLIFFSLSATKLPNYVLPVYPPLALLTARFLDRWRGRTIAVPTWLHGISLLFLGLIGVGTAVGLALAGGLIDAPFLGGHKLPGLEEWAALGVMPVAGSAVAWWCVRRQHRLGLITALSLTAVLYVGALAAGGAVAVDRYKAARSLAGALVANQTEPEIRIGCYLYYQPSLVFYSHRLVNRFTEEADALEFLRYPIPVYLFVPADTWQSWPERAKGTCRVLARHPDLYLGRDVVLVTNR
jgi:4-amino-4-deoxy-L-arabinose transferase-like glycosyltransferase